MPKNLEAAYRAAMFETDHDKLIDEIDSAIPVLLTRLQELDSSFEHLRERQRISDALRTLDMLRRIELKNQVYSGF
jgi:hypothetical protein